MVLYFFDNLDLIFGSKWNSALGISPTLTGTEIRGPREDALRRHVEYPEHVKAPQPPPPLHSAPLLTALNFFAQIAALQLAMGVEPLYGAMPWRS